MPDEPEVRPPIVSLGFMELASWLVPRPDRRAWRARLDSSVRSFCILAERGEMAGDAGWEMAALCRRALGEAFWLRFRREGLRRLAQGPVLPFAAVAAVLFVCGLLTHGFEASRALGGVFQNAVFNSSRASRDTLIPYGFLIVFASTVSMAVVTARGLPLSGRGGKYWSFLGLKTFCVSGMVIALWLETLAAIRANVHNRDLKGCLGGIVLSLIFVFAAGLALNWSLEDQRRRCPICLQRLTMPVSVGTWASVFEPATTELVCEEGHGTLCVSETEPRLPGRWVTLDASWRELFQPQCR